MATEGLQLLGLYAPVLDSCLALRTSLCAKTQVPEHTLPRVCILWYSAALLSQGLGWGKEGRADLLSVGNVAR